MRKQFFKTAQEKLEALMTDGRYQRSIETMIGQSSGEESATALTTLDEQRFFDAKNQLIGEGVAAHTAEANLRMIADAIFATPNAKIDEYLALASQLDQSGEWDQCAEIYSQLISRLPESDDRKVYAQNCLTSVNEKRFANATESSDAPEHEEANQ